MPRRKNDTTITLDDDTELVFPPIRLPNGKVNPDYFVKRYEYVLSADLNGKLAGGTLAQHLQGLEKQAKLLGLDLKEVMDNRSPEQKIKESIDKLLASDGEAALEMVEEEIQAIIKGVDESVALTAAFLARDQREVDEDATEKRVRKAELEARLQRGKRWASVLRKIVRLQRQTRKVRPGLPDGAQPSEIEAWEIAYPLRVMLYAYRSDIESASARRSKLIFEIAPHHAKIVYFIWKAQQGVKIYAKGTDKECNTHPELFHPVGGAVRGVNKMDGCVIVCPPRHGKSAIGTAWTACQIAQNPREQLMMLHAVQAEGSKNFRHVKAAFEDDNAIGRRFRTLYPELMLSDRDNDKKTMRLRLPEPTRDPQVRAIGVRTSVGGANSGKQWWDDPVDPKERDQPDVRADTTFRLMSQVKRRMQGANAFLLVTATIWHPDDATNRLIDDIRTGKIMMSMLVIGTGGPKTNPEFNPVWPEKYPASKLRQIYAEMRSPSDFAAQYMADPRPDEARIVRRLAFYDPHAAAHDEFLRTCMCHASLDPSATSRKFVKHGTDKAGFIYLGVGEITDVTMEDGSELTTTRRVIRILDAKEFHAGPTEAVEMVKEYAASFRVSKVHVEAVAFSMAIVESLRNQLNLSSNEIVAHNPRALNKEQRLKAVAPMLDDSLRDQGMGGAVVEFPGQKGEGDALVIIERMAWLADNILNFGAAKNDHAVDALTQVLKTLIGEVDVSGGSVTNAVRFAATNYSATDIRRRLMQRQYERAGKEPERDVHAEERQFLMVDGANGDDQEDYAWATGQLLE